MINYTAGSNKGQTAQGDVFNNPFMLGKVDKNYTSAAVVDSWQGEAGDTFTPAWTPVVKGAFLNPDDNQRYDLKIIASADGKTYYMNLNEDGTATNVPVGRVAYFYRRICSFLNKLFAKAA